jgi:hypothetical protein
VQYDPQLVRPVDLDESAPGTQLKHDFLNAIPDAITLASLTKDSEGNELHDGNITVGITQLPPYDPVDVDGDVMSLYFTCIAPGSSKINLLAENTRLVSTSGDVPFNTRESGSIDCTEVNQIIAQINLRVE